MSEFNKPFIWITHPTADPHEYGVYHFRKLFILTVIPQSFIIHVSADNQYHLFVNSVNICSGPAQSDISNWYYETIDISAYLQLGINIIGAVVWNMGKFSAQHQISLQSAFVLKGESSFESFIDTDESWRVTKSKAYTPCSTHNKERLDVYIVVGPGDFVDANYYNWGWEKDDYDDSGWNYAKKYISQENINGSVSIYWRLTPRNIPIFTKSRLRFPTVRRTTIDNFPKNFLNGKNSLLIVPHAHSSILLDQTFMTFAYLELITSGGQNAKIKVTYSEALFDSNGYKGNRNDIEDKEIIGNYDIYLLDGGTKRCFKPLSLRAYRYVQIDFATEAESIIVHDVYNTTTGYPYQIDADFNANDQSLKEIWKAGCHTAKLCAGDVFYDTPYYEQLQYTGDSRIQALISLYITGDDRLMKKAILDFHHSILPNGLTQSRYPSNKTRIIPPYSLFWISMIYDYWMHREDDEFIKQFLKSISNILEWFSGKIDRNKNMLGPLPHWNFVDWAFRDDNGSAPGVKDGNSSIITLQFTYTLNQAAKLFKHFGIRKQSFKYSRLAKRYNISTFQLCFNDKKKAIADTPDMNSYSQHAGIWAILSNAVPDKEVNSFMSTLLNDKSLVQVTYFYHFYFNQALKKARLGNLYYSKLTPWRQMLDLGLTTFAEMPEQTRSDCHAWSASPAYDFLATICGIVPNKPGFKEIMIAPSPGPLTEISGHMPHPIGKISITLKMKADNGFSAEVCIPDETKGIFSWYGKNVKLTGGKQTIISRGS